MLTDIDLQKMRQRYAAAFETYQALAARNSKLPDTPDKPSVEQLRLEREALDALIVARRDLLEALRIPDLGQTH